MTISLGAQNKDDELLSSVNSSTRIGSSNSDILPSISAFPLPSVQTIHVDLQSRGDSLIIPLFVNGEMARGLLDIGAQVTLLSSNFVSRMSEPPQLGREVRLKGAEVLSFMTAHLAEEVLFNINGQVYPWCPYVAPVTEEVILGLDFLRHLKCTIDLVAASLLIGREPVEATLRSCDQATFEINRVYCEQDTLVPPWSFKKVKLSCQGCPNKDTFHFSPLSFAHLLVPEAIVSTESPQIYVINCSQSQLHLNKGRHLGFSQDYSILGRLTPEPAEESSDPQVTGLAQEVLRTEGESDSERYFKVRSVEIEDELASMSATLEQLSLTLPEHLRKL